MPAARNVGEIDRPQEADAHDAVIREAVRAWKGSERARQILEAAVESGVLHLERAKNGISIASSLHQILTQPRAPGLDAWEVFWSVLERLFEPATNTQRIAVPFSDGKTSVQTCTVATRLFHLISKQPGEFARIVAELTSPQLGFTLTSTYPDARQLQARIAFLEGHFPYRLAGERTLAIFVQPDVAALPRAILEHDHRKFSDYDFDGSRPSRNSRTAVDVLLQSALTNLALQGVYDSASDSNRRDGTDGIGFESYGLLALHQDLLKQAASVAPDPFRRDHSLWTDSPLDAADAPEV